MGRVLAERVNSGSGPAVVLLPLRGCSRYELPGGPFVDPDADTALFEAIRSRLRPGIACLDVDANINEAAFANAATKAFVSLWAAVRPLPASAG